MSTYHIREVDNRLQGRLALVTGASGGIGSAIARALAAEGCDVVLHCNSSLHKVEALSKTLQSTHPEQLFPCVSANLSSREQTRGLVDAIFRNPTVSSKHKAISILVANAGLGKRIRDVQEIEEDNWDEMMEVNARSQFVVIKSCLPGMRAQSWGRVILVGSIASKGGGINGCHYAATKGALTSMGLNLATLLAGEGVTVNTILPAMIGATDMIPTPKSTTWTSDTNLEALKAMDPGLAIAASIPIHRLGQPDEVANVAVMMAKTGYLTGQEIVLSGGLNLPILHAGCTSGDLRNVIKTVTSLPESFRKRIAITINDNDFEVVARNIILLLTAMFSVEPEDGANRMIHIWYSAFIERSHLQFLHSVVRPKIQKVCSKLENKALYHLHSETFDDGFYSQVSIVLPKKSWVALLGYLEVPEGLSFYQARQVRKAATLPSGHLDYVEHAYYSLIPAQRIS
ncbi:hypothetical protein CEP51_008256 [Fusarium floridanum]|uniref:DUF4470 domain-containing protein n=1 Tax=Fusarium floridanum TaxID=1325733 RepID=A0A428RLI9_9HYPO|nr:hypothetical protein CEP51_008256 [Fusarium floridanum]